MMTDLHMLLLALSFSGIHSIGPLSALTPFNLRVSSTSAWTRCSLSSVSQQEKWSCLQQCVEDTCCKAVSIAGDKCKRSAVENEAMDFIKLVSKVKDGCCFFRSPFDEFNCGYIDDPAYYNDRQSFR